MPTMTMAPTTPLIIQNVAGSGGQSFVRCALIYSWPVGP